MNAIRGLEFIEILPNQLGGRLPGKLLCVRQALFSQFRTKIIVAEAFFEGFT
jgi:hypothetical protein